MSQSVDMPAAERLHRIPGPFSLVLPAFNEEANLGAVVDRASALLPTFVDEFEIIIVNDGSRDRTGPIADALAIGDPRVRVIHHPRNRGYGAALTSGFRASTGRFVMFMDSDRQFDLDDLRLLSPFVTSYDIVAGFRLERNDLLHRRVMAEVFNVVVRILFGVHLRDIDCAFKVFRGDLLRSLPLSAPGALINTEIQAKARRQGASVLQVGVHHYPRLAGHASGGSARVIARAIKETLLLWVRLHTYQPQAAPISSPGRYILGEVAVVGGLVALIGLPVAATRWLVDRRTREAGGRGTSAEPNVE